MLIQSISFYLIYLEIPLFNIEDYIALIDEAAIVSKPLSVIYYVVLDLVALKVVDLRSYFSLILSSLFN